MIETWIIKGILIGFILMLMALFFFVTERTRRIRRFYELAIVWLAVIEVFLMGAVVLIKVL